MLNHKLIDKKENKNLERIYHETVKNVTSDYEKLSFNTAISYLMVFVNAVYKEDVFPREYARGLIKLLNPIVPHITEEIWSEVFNKKETIAPIQTNHVKGLKSDMAVFNFK